MEQSPTHIIEGCITKDARCQEQLYKLMYAEMMKVCVRYTTNFDDAASLYNEAMLKVFDKIAQYKFQGSFNGWVKRVVINTCIDYCRKNTSYKNQQWLEETKAANISVQADAYSNIEAKEIMQLVTTLPRNTATVFNMFVIDGYKHTEIAASLQISEGTSKWHLNEARRLLKGKLEGMQESNWKVVNGK